MSRFAVFYRGRGELLPFNSPDGWRYLFAKYPKGIAVAAPYLNPKRTRYSSRKDAESVAFQLTLSYPGLVGCLEVRRVRDDRGEVK